MEIFDFLLLYLYSSIENLNESVRPFGWNKACKRTSILSFSAIYCILYRLSHRQERAISAPCDQNCIQGASVGPLCQLHASHGLDLCQTQKSNNGRQGDHPANLLALWPRFEQYAKLQKDCRSLSPRRRLAYFLPNLKHYLGVHVPGYCVLRPVGSFRLSGYLSEWFDVLPCKYLGRSDRVVSLGNGDLLHLHVCNSGIYRRHGAREDLRTNKPNLRLQ